MIIISAYVLWIYKLAVKTLVFFCHCPAGVFEKIVVTNRA